MKCPICGSAPDVSFKGMCFVAHCSGCFEGDEDTISDWSNLQGHGARPEDAVAKWLEDAREFTAGDGLPSLRAPYALNYLFRDLAVQVLEESERQSGWRRKLQFGPWDQGARIVSEKWGAP